MPVRRKRSSRKCGCAGVFARKRVSRSYRRRRTRRRSNSKSAYLRKRSRRHSSRKIVRKGYVRRNPNGTVTYVRPALIKSRKKRL